MAFSSDVESDDAFDPSPIPTKRRRISTASSPQENAPPQTYKKMKQGKHVIIIHGKRLEEQEDEDKFIRATEDIPSSAPWHLRGAKWTNPVPTGGGIGPKDQKAPSLPVHKATIEPADSTSDDEDNMFEDLRPLPEKQHSPSQEAQACKPVESANTSFDIEAELADLPSDAFKSSSSSPQKSPPKALASGPVLISSQTSPPPRPNLVAPRNAQMQMNLFGEPARGPTAASERQAVLNWPAPEKNEPLTHHKLNQDNLRSWIYPTNIGSIRDYQYNIVQRGLFNNLLVALPTGLGKTFIAATIMLNYFRWTQDAQIIFVAPTKPLVAQQVDACFGIAGIPRSQTISLTGGISPGLRAEEWASKRLFFTTPQTIQNDLQSGLANPKRIVLLVVDEAHRATGNYSYVKLVKFIRRFNTSFRILALTATPGNSVEAVQEVINGLDIARVEIRTEYSLDIRQYVHSRKTDRKIFEYDEHMTEIMELLSKALQPVLNQLVGQNAYWEKDPLRITPYGLTQARQKWMASDTGKRAHMGIKAMVNRIFSLLASLAHNTELLKYHGLAPFFHNMLRFRDESQYKNGGKYENMIRDSEDFKKMMKRLQMWMNFDEFVGHPKLEFLQELVLDHFAQVDDVQEVNNNQQPPRSTRIMIFAHFRDSAEEIVRVLKRHQPIIKPHVFVGQTASKGSAGMDQKRQNEVIAKFKSGEYNTLVATSIGEEGLDIGEVDLIVCYDSSSSPIRMLQRMGRTGRKRAGNIVLLLMKGKEEDSFIRAKDSYEKMQAMIANGDKFEFHDDRSPRILPKEYNPEPEPRHVEIPVENTQAPLPGPTKKGRRAPKRPPKKFHMPDNVRTGFVKASRMDADSDEDDDGDLALRRNPKDPPAADFAPIPTHASVQLSRQAQEEFERTYLQVHGLAEDIIISVPSTEKYPQQLRQLGSTKYVKHSTSTRNTNRLIKRMRAIDDNTVSRWQRLSKEVDIDSLCGPIRAVSHSPTASPSPEPAKKPQAKRGRPVKATKATTATKPAATKRKQPPAKSKAAAAPKTPVQRKPRGRPPKGRRFAADDSDDMEAPESSAPATDPHLMLPSQGIVLGSGDTSGEDEQDEELDSSMRGFLVGSDEVVADGTDDSEDELGLARGLGSDDDRSESDGGRDVDNSQSLADVNDLMGGRSRLKKPDVRSRPDMSPASKRLSQAFGKRKRNGFRKVLDSDDDDE